MKKFLLIKNKLIIFALIFSLLTLPTFPTFSIQTENIQLAIDFLETQTPDPWITMAQVSAGEIDLDLSYLKEVSGNLATDYEKTILALTAAGKNPKTFGNIDFVAQLKTFYRDNQIGSSDLLNDDFWGILALVSAGESISGQIIQDSKNFILNNQNEDGGWSYSVGGTSDTNDTAVAIMALLEASLSSDDPSILKAIGYLKSSQNEDGGFPYLLGGESDSGSDSWVISAIYKLGQNPLDWTKNDKNPIDHLKSLQREDGSFKWIASEDKGYPILTAYAVIALTENYYPINRLHHLRIEGENNNICDANVKAKTALDIVENGAQICGYTYLIEESGWGPYLKKINDEEAHDLIGWLYFVNFEMPMIGAADYILGPGDEVLWYFGEWGWLPSKLTLTSQQVDPGNNLEAKVEYFEDSEWKPLAEALIYIGSLTFTTDQDGEADLVINNPGTYQVYAEKLGYIRANQVSLLVGEGISQNVGLRVEIIQPVPPVPEIGFIVDKNQIDFGRLAPGTEVSDELLIQNTGNTDVYIEGIIKGDQIFIENITLNELNWSEFSTTVDTGLEKDISVGLKIPTDWADFGIKEGDLTFWAIANQ
ncbi:DUF4430 domain-containing protein [Patescibacteria group bacterium]|nr:DUF4430 domain-containing protein [Patescibacteria group bacterium]